MGCKCKCAGATSSRGKKGDKGDKGDRGIQGPAGGLLREVFQITQAEARDLNNLNEGNGYLLFSDYGANSLIRIFSVVLKFNIDGLQPYSPSPFTEIGVYGYNTAATYIMQFANEGDIENDKALIFAMSDVVDQANTKQKLNDAIFLYGNIPNNLEGTATLVVDYEIIDFDNL